MLATFHLHYPGQDQIWQSWSRKYYTTTAVIFFLLFSTAIFLLHCMRNILRYEKMWNWWVDCFIADPSCDAIFLGVHSESIFPFMKYFFSQENCFLWSPCLLLIAESINLDTSGFLLWGFSWKLLLHLEYFSILSIWLDELNSIDWLLKSSWWIFLK